MNVAFNASNLSATIETAFMLSAVNEWAASITFGGIYLYWNTVQLEAVFPKFSGIFQAGREQLASFIAALSNTKTIRCNIV